MQLLTSALFIVVKDLCWINVDLQYNECSFVWPGAVGLVWFVLWAFLVFDSPNTHPRISERERLYITNSLKNEVMTETRLTSLYVLNDKIKIGFIGLGKDYGYCGFTIPFKYSVNQLVSNKENQKP